MRPHWRVASGGGARGGAGGGTGGGGGESEQHLRGKANIAKAINSGRILVQVRHCGNESHGWYTKEFVFSDGDHAAFEKREKNGVGVFDVVALSSDGTMIAAFEVWHSHMTETPRMNTVWFEFRAEDAASSDWEHLVCFRYMNKNPGCGRPPCVHCEQDREKKKQLDAEKKRRTEQKRIEDEKRAEQKRIEDENRAYQKRVEDEKRAEQKRIEDDKRAEQQRIEDEKLAEQQRIENEKRDEKIRLRKRDLDNLYATLVTSPTPPYPRCERHAKLAETPIGCDRCAVARRAWMDVARRVAHETFTIGNVYNTDAAKKLREAWWDDWAKGNDESMARLAEMRSKEVL